MLMRSNCDAITSKQSWQTACSRSNAQQLATAKPRESYAASPGHSNEGIASSGYLVRGATFDQAQGTLCACYELGAMAAQLTIAHRVKSTMQADVIKVNRRPAKGNLIFSLCRCYGCHVESATFCSAPTTAGSLLPSSDLCIRRDYL